jgi:hypothetical protein
MLYAVSDSVLGAQPTIYTIDASKRPAVVTDELVVKRDGAPAQKLDIEGIAAAADGSFWLASEGYSERLVPHALTTSMPRATSRPRSPCRRSSSPTKSATASKA